LPGLPGLSIQGEPGEIGPIGPPGPPSFGDGDGLSSKVVPGVAALFQSRDEMLEMSENSPVATIAFVKDEQTLFTRVSQGWKPILVCLKTEPYYVEEFV